MIGQQHAYAMAQEEEEEEEEEEQMLEIKRNTHFRRN